jgi:hypothetical protein
MSAEEKRAEAMELWYGARRQFGEQWEPEPGAWKSYVERSGLWQLTEVITLDQLLNPSVGVETEDHWDELVLETFRGELESINTSFYRSLSFVERAVSGAEPFHVLAVAPDGAAREIPGFEFLGFDLVDESYAVSPLTNCGGFPKVFVGAELNRFGLLSDRSRALGIGKELPRHYPDNPHVKCRLFAIWRRRSTQ